MWPADVIAVADSVYTEFAANATPAGKYRTTGADGLPAWADIPEPTQEQIYAANISTRNRLRHTAVNNAATLQCVIASGVYTEQQQTALDDFSNYLAKIGNMTPEDLSVSPAS